LFFSARAAVWGRTYLPRRPEEGQNRATALGIRGKSDNCDRYWQRLYAKGPVQFRRILRALLNRPGGRLTTYGERHLIASLLSLVPVPLPRLFLLFGTDKQKFGGHSYGGTYKGLFRGLRYRRLKLLEIGVLRGESLLAWRAYFPRAVTVGLDLDDKRALTAGKRTRVYQGDQGSAADLSRICAAEGPFDIVIDDGSHLSRHQLFSFLRLFPHIKDGGLYVIEDVQTSFWSGNVAECEWDGRHITDPQFAHTCYGWFLDLAKYLNHAEFKTLDDVDGTKMKLGEQIRRIVFEHNIIVVEKGPNTEPSNLIHRPTMKAGIG